VEISVLLTTRTGEQWAAERALLRRLVVRLQEARIPLASAAIASEAGAYQNPTDRSAGI
jgi:hypothetical protein